MILIVSFTDNEHVDEVRRHLTAPHAVVDVAWFPSEMQLVTKANGDGTHIHLRLPSGEGLDLAEVGAVWYRRIRPYGLHPELRDDTSRLFAWSECNEALLGVWYTLPCFWMNPPLGDEVAQRKIHQLRLAQLVGLSVPNTLVTNDPDEARMFVEEHGPGQVVRKAFRNIQEAPRETALVGENEVALLEAVRYAPVIFQRFVPAVADLRVTIVDGEVFVAEIRSDSDHQTDYRAGLGTATVRASSVPDEVSDRLRQLMSHLGVTFGAIDMRITPEGDHVFLEINPAGEYLFISRRTGLPIPEAIAAALQRHDR
jgi:Prokaryotic glutathione synthetase, ATP-grasp domain